MQLAALKGRLAASRARTGVIFGLSRVGFTRLDKNTMYRSFTGSMMIEVPVNPVWPKVTGEAIASM